MDFSIETPIKPQTPEKTHVPIYEANDLKATISKLNKENEELQLNLNQVTLERNGLRFNLKKKEEKLNKSEEVVEVEMIKRKRVGECLAWAGSGLDVQNKRLDEALKINRELKDLCERNLKDLKAII